MHTKDLLNMILRCTVKYAAKILFHSIFFSSEVLEDLSIFIQVRESLLSFSVVWELDHPKTTASLYK